MAFLKPYFIVILAVILVACSYAVAWYNINNLSAQESVERVYEGALMAHKPTAEVTVTALTQSEVSATVQALSLVHYEGAQTLPRWQKNAHHVMLDKEKVYIAIVIDDVGVVGDRSLKSVEDLPKEVTLSFLPYGEYSLELAQKANEMGHEIMIHLPMEAKEGENGYKANPGENALYTSLQLEEIEPLVLQNFKDLAAISVGVNNHMGSKFTEWEEGLKEVFKQVEKEELIFLDSLTTANSAVSKAIEGFDIPFLKRDVFLDHEIEEEKILQSLAKAEEVAKAKGFAIAIGHPHTLTTDILKRWVKTLDDKKIQLVPITALIEGK